jgi:REP element-mobilizing transposase RayT
MSRGNNKQHIFVDSIDFTHFLELLASLLERFDVQCVGYCLMWNHTHLLLRPRQQPLSRLMQHLNSAYCQRFNRRHSRVGHVLQGRFKALWVEDDLYFLRVLRYIVRNPVAAGYVTEPAAWAWSSHRATAGLDRPAPCLDVQAVWDMFGHTDSVTAAEQFRIFAATRVDDVGVRGALLAGSQGFARGLAPQIEPRQREQDFIYAERFAPRPPLGDLLPPGAPGPQLHAAVRMAFLSHAYTLREIGDALGRPSSTIWSWVQRAQQELLVEEPVAADTV